MPIPIEALQGLPLLTHLPNVTLEHLARNATARWFNKREVVAPKGERVNALCFLRDGRLQGMDFTSDGREVGLYFIQPGDYFCEVSVIDNAEQSEFVTAVARSEVFFFPKDLVRPVLFSVPKIAETLCQRLAERLREGLAQRRILGLTNPLQRVCAQLEVLMKASEGALSQVVVNAPTHQELAIMINASRETVTRVFQLLQGRGVVERDGNNLQILMPSFISQVASGELEVGK
jgi:CRP/FNR family cyclic AMP-dependent transcriptional regulator